MNIPVDSMLPILFWLPVVSLVLNFILAIFLIVIIQKGKLKPKEQQEIEDQMIQIIKQAEMRSTEIIEKATKKAKDIVSDASATKQLVESKLNKLVEDTTDTAQNQLDIQKGAIVEKFKETYGQLVEQYQGETQSLFANLQHEAREQQTAFREGLHKETVSILQQMKDNAEKQIEDVSREINEYRNRMFEKIDEHAESVIKQYISDYFSTGMTKENQENILFKALDRFKKNHSRSS